MEGLAHNNNAKTAPGTTSYDEWHKLLLDSGLSDDLIAVDGHAASTNLHHPTNAHRQGSLSSSLGGVPQSPASDPWWGMAVDQPKPLDSHAQMESSSYASHSAAAHRDSMSMSAMHQSTSSAYSGLTSSATVERPGLTVHSSSYLASTPAFPVFPQHASVPSQYLGVNGPSRYMAYPQPPSTLQHTEMTRNMPGFAYRAEKIERDERSMAYSIPSYGPSSCTYGSSVPPLASTGFALSGHHHSSSYQNTYDDVSQMTPPCTCDTNHQAVSSQRTAYSQQQLHHHVAPSSLTKRAKLDHLPADSASSPLPLSPLALGVPSGAYTDSGYTQTTTSSQWPTTHTGPTSPPGQDKQTRSTSRPTSPKSKVTAPTAQRGVKRKFDKIESLLKNLSDSRVSFHVYDNSQRLFMRYRHADGWKLRDVGDLLSVTFHTEGSDSIPLSHTHFPLADARPTTSPMPTTAPGNTNMDDSFHSSSTSPASDLYLPDLFNNVLHPSHSQPPFDGSLLYDFPESLRPSHMKAEVSAHMPAVKQAKRELQLDFKRKEHYWRRGIWIRVAVDVVTTDGVSVRDAGGSINVALLSVKGDSIKRSCDKCSKYYFRYKNVECDGYAPAFEIEEKERSTQVRAGRASFNIRVWECSHHFLSPHTLMFSWLEPDSGNIGASCLREIVISSGSGQERKLKDMLVSRQDALQLYLDALVHMDDALYSRAIESLRCLRWKSFHFLGPVLAPYDEKIGDCYMRMSDYNNASDCFNRAIRQLTHSKDKLGSTTLRYYMLAVLYLKQATLEYLRQRDGITAVFEEEIPCKLLLKARSAFNKATFVAGPPVVKEEEEETPHRRTPLTGFGTGISQSESEELAVVKRYLSYTYYVGLAGLYLKLKPHQASASKHVGPITTELIRNSLHEARVALDALLGANRPQSGVGPASSLYSPQLSDLLEPLLSKMHIGIDGLQKLLRSPLITNSAIVTLSSDTALTPEILVSVYNDLKEATEHTAQLHPKGHRTLFISRCLLALVSYLIGHCHRDDALRTVEDQARAMNRFWQQVSSNAVAATTSNSSSSNTNAGRFECRQMSALADYLRSAPPASPLLAPDYDTSTTTNPLAGIFGDQEHMQLFRLWLHSPLDVVLWHHLFSATSTLL